MPSGGVVPDLVAAVGRDNVLVADDLTARHRTDWTGRWTGSCAAVARPATTAETAAVVTICATHGHAVVPQGGNTGLVGGAVPRRGAVVLSTQRLAVLGPVDTLAGQLTAGAGATLAAVQDAADRAGWRYPVDFAARDSATIGGTIATNAGGHHVLRHGMTRRHVVGIEAVLADGRVLSHLGGLVKDNTGYDLPGLLCGSEGTLAVVTAARLALTPRTSGRTVALVGFEDLGSLVDAVARLRASLAGLEALELMLADGIEAVAVHRGRRSPLAGAPAALLVETAGDDTTVEQMGDAIGALEGVREVAVATDERSAADLWAWREAHTEVINAAADGAPHKFDVTVPLDRIPAMVDDVRRTVAAHRAEARVWIFGHAGDGNLHVNVTGLDTDDEHVDAAVYGLVAAVGGSISAEHGIGRAKRSHLHLSRSAVEIDTFRAIKDALDPAGVLNPGVLLPGS
ncbi:MAG: FAD-binding oxidoreductase [Acidimicrobiales bacterium]